MLPLRQEHLEAFQYLHDRGFTDSYGSNDRNDIKLIMQENGESFWPNKKHRCQ